MAEGITFTKKGNLGYLFIIYKIIILIILYRAIEEVNLIHTRKEFL